MKIVALLFGFGVLSALSEASVLPRVCSSCVALPALWGNFAEILSPKGETQKQRLPKKGAEQTKQ